MIAGLPIKSLLRIFTCSLPGRENSDQAVDQVVLRAKNTWDGFFRGLDAFHFDVGSI